MLSVSCVLPSTSTKPPCGAGRAGAAGAAAAAGAEAGVESATGGRACCTTGVVTTGAAAFGASAAFGSTATDPSLVAASGALLCRRVLAALTPATPRIVATDANPRNCMRNLWRRPRDACACSWRQRRQTVVPGPRSWVQVWVDGDMAALSDAGPG